MRVHSQGGHKSDVLNIGLRATLPVNTRVAIGSGALEGTANLLLQNHVGKKVLVLTQPPVQKKYAEGLVSDFTDAGFYASMMVVPDGEECKDYDNLLMVWQKLKESGFTRQDTVVAVGGGALSDLAGFAASTYLRGVNLVLVPTTLLGQVDAAIGGKTGINLNTGKNMAGTFYFPVAVVVDPDVLATLPEREFLSGLGEIIKYALIELTVAEETDYRSGPRTLLSVLEDLTKAGKVSRQDVAMGNIITACVKMKLAVVGKDPLEGRLRRSLNLGHTLAHAVETVSHFSYTHGEAVAIGSVFACRVAHRRGCLSKGDLDRVINVVSSAGLPTKVPEQLAGGELSQAMALDKKRSQEGIKFVLPKSPLGTVNIDDSLSIAEIAELLT